MAEDHRDAERQDLSRPYPPYVLTEEQRRRWDLAETIATDLHRDDGAAMIWQATRAIYQSSIATGA